MALDLPFYMGSGNQVQTQLCTQKSVYKLSYPLSPYSSFLYYCPKHCSQLRNCIISDVRKQKIIRKGHLLTLQMFHTFDLP